jgi:hypothetical protein
MSLCNSQNLEADLQSSRLLKVAKVVQNSIQYGFHHLLVPLCGVFVAAAAAGAS